MASYSEIHKLEQRHRENPDGRTFAPLADAYRRAGRLPEAHQLVQAGLLKHPQYVSAHIVLGRCLIDMGDSAAARLAFEQVYALDSENIIALRMLSELAEGEGRLSDAEYWLRQALEVDPMNPDIRDGLERIAAAATAPSSETAAVDAAAADAAAEAEQLDEAVVEANAELPLAEPPAAEAAAPRDEPTVVEPARVEGREWSSETDDLVIERAPAAEPPESASAPPAELDLDLEVERVGEDAWSTSDLEPADSSGTETPPSVADVEIERVSDEGSSREAPAWMPVGIDAGSIVPYDGRIDFSRVEPESATPLEIEPDEPELVDAAEGDVTPVEGLAATQFESLELLDEPPETAAAGYDAAVELPPEEPALTELAPEAIAGDEPTDLADLDLEPARADESPAAAGEEDLAALFGEAENVRGRADSALADLPVFIPDEDDDLSDLEAAAEEDYQAADHESLDQAEPVVTETMAELLVSQGHLTEAIRVYRALLAARPGDEGLTRRLASLEGRPAPAEGPTVGELFRALVAAELALPEHPQRPEPGSHGEASAAAVDVTGGGDTALPLSLDEVFGGAESAPSQPAVAAEAVESVPAAAPAQPKDPDAFSFDAFFGSDAEASETGSEPGGDPESDLDEFQAWLRGLKS